MSPSRRNADGSLLVVRKDALVISIIKNVQPVNFAALCRIHVNRRFKVHIRIGSEPSHTP